MKEHRSEFSVEKMAALLGISKSGFYEWFDRPQSSRAIQRVRFDAEVKAIFDQSAGTYGSKRIIQELVKKGYGRNRKRVAESMVRQGLVSKVHKKFKVCTTDSRHSYKVAPNIVDRNFTESKANQVWVTDITYLPTRNGWLYLTVFIDLFSRFVVGWALSTSLSHEAVLTALQRGIWRRKPADGLIIHSDRGVQFCCEEFKKVLKDHHFIQSMSRKGNCWDNAVAESFFKTLKMEAVYHIDLLDEHQAQHVLFDYIEGFYNCRRLHSTLGYLSPAEFEVAKRAKCA